MPFIATVNNHTLHYTDIKASPGHANSCAPVILMIHGLGSTQNCFIPLLPWLAAFRCILFDLYGSGRSGFDLEPQPEPSVACLSADAFDLLDKLGVQQQAILVAHSMGGIIASHMASTSPTRILAVVSVSQIHPDEALATMCRERAQLLRNRDDGLEDLANRLPTTSTGGHSNNVQKAFIRELLLAQRKEAYIYYCNLIQGASAPDYESLAQPFLMIVGESDNPRTLAGCKSVFERIRSVVKDMAILQNVGHWPTIEASDQVGELIRDFCTQRLPPVDNRD
ncbi:uncharacterized protein Z520_07693 [Fonsecaea multimorphosa CBS 102226]|uniref:AB hydrolase-1 domain-containing protein n=1 Tax=Fonsecaea multimorphosa CBS 102226 TaxID=1442371 RepID=A0A0D2JSJ9_9EURO|nr:uncharacterized protein Z520_07693 [Fonsecaea multimorphosa CBS 102226]KIX96427.1 hypothetical protein Z520_07693 [Fonsecaea multimorphosa CBS 102226]